MTAPRPVVSQAPDRPPARSIKGEEIMSKVVTNMSMSLDGLIEDASGVTEVFARLAAGDRAVAAPGDEREFRVSQASAEHLRWAWAWAGTGALVCGRRLPTGPTDGAAATRSAARCLS